MFKLKISERALKKMTESESSSNECSIPMAVRPELYKEVSDAENETNEINYSWNLDTEEKKINN